MFSLIWALPAAMAADPVLHAETSDATALSRVAAASGRDSSAFEGLPFVKAAVGAPRAVGGVVAQTCAGATSTPEQADYGLKRVEGALAYGDAEKAAAELGEVRRVFSCLGAPPAALAVARYEVLLGVTAAYDGKDPAAAFAAAAAIPAKVTWDDTWPTGAKTAFDAATAPSPVVFRVFAPGQVITVDGLPADGRITPGQHVVVAGGLSAFVTVTRSGSLVFPSFYTPDMLDDVAETGPAREELSALLASAVGEGMPALVVAKSGVWTVTAGRDDWEDLARVAPSLRPPIGWTVAGVGAAAAIGGGVTATLFSAKAKAAAADQTAATSFDAYDDATARYDAAIKPIPAARWIGIGGAMVAAVGVTVAAIPVKLTAGPGGLAVGGAW